MRRMEDGVSTADTNEDEYYHSISSFTALLLHAVFFCSTPALSSALPGLGDKREPEEPADTNEDEYYQAYPASLRLEG